MQSISADSVYISALFAVIAVIGWAGAVDMTLYFRGELTISAWLRIHPAWFYIALTGILLFSSAAIIHLFIFD
jgi:hypothetical protein